MEKLLGLPFTAYHLSQMPDHQTDPVGGGLVENTALHVDHLEGQDLDNVALL